MPLVQIEGTLEVSSDLQDVNLDLGRLKIDESGELSVGTRSSYHAGNFQVTLNSSLVPEKESHIAVSTLDVHGTLKMWSKDLELQDGPVQSWKAGQFSEDSFILEEDQNAAGFTPGTILGLVSSHGEEIVAVKKVETADRAVHLSDKLKIKHGKSAIVYNLSRRMKIKADGPAVLRVWNGRHHAGGGVDPLAPPDEHTHKRRLAADMHTSVSSTSRQKGFWRPSVGPRRNLLADKGANRPEDRVSDSGYLDRYIYRTSIQPDDTGAVLELHGVEIDGLGLEEEFGSKAALELVDHACAVRWPEYRKYVSIISTTMHSLPSGCILFNGCTGGFEVRLFIDVYISLYKVYHAVSTYTY